MMTERVGIVVVAGGSGSRMGAAMPKQFLEIAGRPILVRTVERMHEALPEAEIVVVLPEAHVELWQESPVLTFLKSIWLLICVPAR